jgi:uncharacterized protein
MNRSWTFVIFIVVALTVYSLLNAYFIRKHYHAITLGLIPTLLVRLVLFVLVLTPIATMVFSWQGSRFIAAITGLTGYSWLAFLFLFLAIHGSADITLFVIEKAGVRTPAYTARILFLFTLSVSLLILFYGMFEARRIRIEPLEIITDRLPADVESVTLVQISDVHFSALIGVPMAERMVELIQAQQPDLIVLTGDLLDRGIADPEGIIRALQSLEAPLGRFAVMGNHEYYYGQTESEQFLAEAGFRLLRDETLSVDGILNLVGVDDPTGADFKVVPQMTERALLDQAQDGRYTILLKHQPLIDNGSLGLFDLQLSGHTHGGQIFPFTLLVKLAFPKICGWYELDDRSRLYVSRGTGTWGPPVRFLSPPEITLIRLRRGQLER